MNEGSIYKSKVAEFNLKYLYTVEGSVTFTVYVHSSGFSGSYNFCLNNEEINLILRGLKDMHLTLTGKCEIMDSDSDSFISFEFVEMRLKIVGQIGASYEENFLKFSFIADQTVVKLVIETLRTFLIY